MSLRPSCVGSFGCSCEAACRGHRGGNATAGHCHGHLAEPHALRRLYCHRNQHQHHSQQSHIQISQYTQTIHIQLKFPCICQALPKSSGMPSQEEMPAPVSSSRAATQRGSSGRKQLVAAIFTMGTTDGACSLSLTCASWSVFSCRIFKC